MTIPQIRTHMHASEEFANGVRVAFRQFLAREISASDLKWFRESTISLEQTRQNILDGPEYARRIEDIRNVYRKYLGRDAEQAARDGFGRSGKTIDQIRGEILAGGEYRGRLDGIRTAFRAFLGREVEQSALDWYGGSFMTMDQMRQHIRDSQEFADRIRGIFLEVLRREPDASGLAWYKGSGMNLAEIRAHMMQSPEYKNGGDCECVTLIKNTFHITAATGHAYQMGSHLTSQAGFNKLGEPVNGAVVIFQPKSHGADATYGHVGFVENVRENGAAWTFTVRGANQGAVTRPAESSCRNIGAYTVTVPKNDATVAFYSR